MHMLGTPRTMQDDPAYDDVVDDVRAFLAERIEAARRRPGSPRSGSGSIPGSGSARRSSTTSSCCAGSASCATSAARSSSAPRARASSASSPAARSTDRIGGTIASNVLALRAGAEMLRVHDVARGGGRRDDRRGDPAPSPRSSIQSASARAPGSPSASKIAVPERCLRPSRSSGQPTTMCGSPTGDRGGQLAAQARQHHRALVAGVVVGGVAAGAVERGPDDLVAHVAVRPRDRRGRASRRRPAAGRAVDRAGEDPQPVAGLAIGPADEAGREGVVVVEGIAGVGVLGLVQRRGLGQRRARPRRAACRRRPAYRRRGGRASSSSRVSSSGRSERRRHAQVHLGRPRPEGRRRPARRCSRRWRSPAGPGSAGRSPPRRPPSGLSQIGRPLR